MKFKLYYKYSAYAIAIWTTAIAVMLTKLLEPLLVPFLSPLFFLAIVVSSYRGFKPGLLSSILSALAINYFFIPPLNSFSSLSVGDIVRTGSFLLVAFVINLLNSNLRSSKKAEQISQQLLKAHAEQLSLALTAARMGTWDWDLITDEIKWSPEHAQLFGLAPGKFDGRYDTFNACVHPDDREGIAEAVNLALQEKTIYQHEYRVVWADGSVHWLEGRGQGFYDHTGKAVRMMGTIMDMSDRILAQERIKQSEERYRALIDATFQIVWTADEWGNTTSISPAWLDLTGNTWDEMQQWGWLDYLHPEDISTAIETWQHALATCNNYAIEYRLRAKDGNYRHFWARGVPVINQDGSIREWIGTCTDITERKQAEAQIAQLLSREQAACMEAEASRRRLASILERITDAFVALDANWRYTYVNRKAGEVFCRQPEDLVGKYIWEEFPEGIGQNFYHAYYQAITAQKPTYFEAYYPPWDRWYENRIYPSPEGLTIFFRETTERKRIEAAREISEARYRALVTATTQAVWICNAEGHPLDDTSSWRALTGQTEAQMQGFGWLAAIHPEDRERTQAVWLEATRTKSFYEVEHRLLTAAGIYRIFAVRAVPLCDRHGNISEWVGTCTDITERKQAEITLKQANEDLENRVQARTAELTALTERLQLELWERQRTEEELREANRRWRSLLDNVQLIVVGIDRMGNVEYVNPFFLKTTGYSLTDVLGKNWFDNFLPPSQQQVVNTAFIEVLEHNFHSYYENPIITKSGEERYIAWNNTILRDGQGNIIGTMSIAEDITQRQAVERMKNEFISIVSHELRTPLTAIRGSLGLLATGIYDNKPQKARRMIEIALTDSERLVRLVNDILDLERLDSGRVTLVKQVCDAAELIQRAVEGVQAIADAESITLAISPGTAQVWAAPDTIIQTLTNLLSNALKFSPPNTTITITVCPQSKQVLFQVQDQGRGIPGDKLESIFGRFQQVDASDSRTKEGTGLGLAICKSIIQQHGGKIWVESTLNQGSTFYFTLPMPE